MKRNVLLVLMSLSLALAVNGETLTREFDVPGHGALKVSWPSSWILNQRKDAQSASPIIELSDSAGNVRVVITPIWSSTDDAHFTSPDNIRAAVDRAAQAMKMTVTEMEPLHEMAARSGRGYYFWVTNPAPKNGDYEYTATGAVPAGQLLVNFTISSHQPPPKGIAVALAVASTSAQISTSW